MKNLPICRRIVLAGAAIIASFSSASHLCAQQGETFYYWVTPHPALPQGSKPESFVVKADSAAKAQIDSIRRQGGVPGFTGRVSAGAAEYNKNYYASGHPVWNWHISKIDGIADLNETYFVPCPPACDPRYYAHPSDIAVDPAGWIAANGDQYTPVRYWIQREIDPRKSDAVANVSNRGMTGGGEKALITGFIIKGGEPRNVVVRALGPSMSAAGVQQPAGNPKIEVYQGSRQIAINSDWRTDTRSSGLNESYSALAPTDDKEAALLLTLMPGTYTLHGLNEDGTEGVLLLEAYDVDSVE